MAEVKTDDLLSRAADLVALAKRSGAEAADVVVVKSQSLGISWRLGKLEDVERSESSDLGLRVFAGKRQAFVSSTDLDGKGFAALAERVRVADADLGRLKSTCEEYDDAYAMFTNASMHTDAIRFRDLVRSASGEHPNFE